MLIVVGDLQMITLLSKNSIVIMLFSLLVGCNFLQVQVEITQRAVLDNGENKKKVISDNNTDEDEDITKTVIKATVP